jgi:xanthine dehydrogenase YagR molybdenum-binding subunit
VALGVTPYVFDPPNRNRTATGIITHCGPDRAWRAPNHPQACAYTDTALDDLAAKAGIDSLTFFQKNLDLTNLPNIYGPELEIAAKLMDWKAKWHPRGLGEKGPVKRGVGLALHTWGGGPHQSNVLLKIHPDGTVEVLMGSQDIGTGTRTCIAMVAAETFGIPLSSVKVNIGLNKYPQAGPSGGSTTIGGVTGPVRRTSQQALWKVFDLVAAKFNVDGTTLTAKSGKISSNGKEICTWQQAANLVGPMALEVTGGPVKEEEGLTNKQVGGVQMAEVAVDTETGIVRMVKMVAVQDIGMVVNRLLARSQVYGALIMGIAYSLSEERITDNKTGRFINANLTDYKLPRIGDIGDLVVEFYEPESEYKRGVIGLGEPPVIAPGAAISNAVANAIGVRVPVLPLTPKRVLDALKKA